MHIKPYCDAHTHLRTTGCTNFGEGGNMIGLMEHTDLTLATKLYFDNSFASVSVTEELSKRSFS